MKSTVAAVFVTDPRSTVTATTFRGGPVDYSDVGLVSIMFEPI